MIINKWVLCSTLCSSIINKLSLQKRLDFFTFFCGTKVYLFFRVKHVRFSFNSFEHTLRLMKGLFSKRQLTLTRYAALWGSVLINIAVKKI